MPPTPIRPRKVSVKSSRSAAKAAFTKKTAAKVSAAIKGPPFAPKPKAKPGVVRNTTAKKNIVGRSATVNKLTAQARRNMASNSER